jgi:hypothetical protein
MRPVLILLTFLTATAAFAATPQGFALGDQPANPLYAPNPATAYNSTGGPIRITRTGVGLYKVTFFGLGAAGAGHKSDVQVTAVAGRITCNTGGWGGGPDLTVDVNCFYIPDGSLHDSKYTVLVTYSP